MLIVLTLVFVALCIGIDLILEPTDEFPVRKRQGGKESAKERR